MRDLEYIVTFIDRKQMVVARGWGGGGELVF